MTTFDYRGQTIEFLARTGRFSASVNGNFIQRTSLSAAKKAVDAELDNQFKPFAAWRQFHEFEKACVGEKFLDLVKIKIKGTIGYKRGNSVRRAFIDVEGKEYVFPVLLDTSENLEAYSRAKAYREETNRIYVERRAEQDRLDDAIKQVDPNDFLKGGSRK